jgi:hypothetical protein
MTCNECPLKYAGQTLETLELDIKNIHKLYEPTNLTPYIQNTY